MSYRICLPYPNYAVSAHVLSPDDLATTRQTILLVLRSLSPYRTERENRYSLTREMWKGWEASLLSYAAEIDLEYYRRGYELEFDFPSNKIEARNMLINPEFITYYPHHPTWLGWEELHLSWKQVLLFHDRPWYDQFRWDVPTRMGPVWPGRIPKLGEYLTCGSECYPVVAESTRSVTVRTASGFKKISKYAIYTRRWNAASVV